jgi:polysaccharide biosynthesis/export protein
MGSVTGTGPERRLGHQGVRGGQRSLVLALALLFATAACAPTPPPPPMTTHEQGQAETYRIGSLDRLEIFVWGADSLSAKVPVRPDGKISVPLAEDIQAVGRTPAELAQAIEGALQPYVQNPLVTVIVASFGDTAGQTIRVVGEAQKPAAIPYRAGMTVLDVMVAAGGLSPYAAGNRAVLVRGKDQAVYGLRLGDLLNGGDISADAPVLPGDVVMIPQTAF